MPGYAEWARIDRSVSSHPSGVLPTRPRSEANPPTVVTTSRRKDMLAPIGFLTTASPGGMPR